MVKSVKSDKKRSPKKGLCLWAQAGVINKQDCDENYICESCKIDKDLNRQANENLRLRKMGKNPTGTCANVVHWREKMKEKPVGQQLCLHSMKGQIGSKNCINDYSCVNCDFDQFFHDQYAVHAVVRPIDVLDISGFKIPQGYYYHRGHTWAKIEEGSEVRIGIDDFTYHVLGPPDSIKTPLLGKELVQGESQITLKRGGNFVSFPSPVSGIITAVNHKLTEDGGLAHGSPYSDGWLVRVHATNLRKDLKNLSMGAETEETLSSDIERLYELIEATGQPLAADGGQLVDDLFGAMPELSWDQLVEQFFTLTKKEP